MISELVIITPKQTSSSSSSALCPCLSCIQKGKKYNPENYRQISLTCICCHLLEHLIVKHIMSHADTRNILYPLQHGFCTDRSCETQLLDVSMMSLLTWKMENKQIFWSWIFQKLLTRSHTLFFYINYTIMAYRAN